MAIGFLYHGNWFFISWQLVFYIMAIGFLENNYVEGSGNNHNEIIQPCISYNVEGVWTFELVEI